MDSPGLNEHFLLTGPDGIADGRGCCGGGGPTCAIAGSWSPPIGVPKPGVPSNPPPLLAGRAVLPRPPKGLAWPSGVVGRPEGVPASRPPSAILPGLNLGGGVVSGACRGGARRAGCAPEQWGGRRLACPTCRAKQRRSISAPCGPACKSICTTARARTSCSAASMRPAPLSPALLPAASRARSPSSLSPTASLSRPSANMLA